MAEQARNQDDSSKALVRAENCWIESGTGFQAIQTSLLAEINATQRQLGSTSRYKYLPCVPENVTAVLQGKRILIVDDSVEVLQHWSPTLLAATMGSSMHVLHTDQSMVDLCREITLKTPEIVLLDYSLSGGVIGTTLAARLKLLLPNVLVIGFASIDDSNHSFIKSGVLYTANKSREEEALERIATAVKFHTGKTQKKNVTGNGFSPFFQEIEEKFGQRYSLSFVRDQCVKLSQLFKKDSFDNADYHSNSLLNIADSGRSSLRCYLAALDHERLLFCGQRAGTANGNYLYTGHDHRALAPFLSLLVPLLPERTRRVVEHLDLVSAQPGNDSFALLFHEGGHEGGARYLITQDKQLRMNDCFHYDYLSIGPTGEALLRAKTNAGGGRAFFDGFRFMAHPEFTSCALDPIFRKGNYQFDSKKHAIVNGFLFEFGEKFTNHCGWGQAEFLSQGVLQHKGMTLQATGKFLPSTLHFNERTGFSDVEWSAFQLL